MGYRYILLIFLGQILFFEQATSQHTVSFTDVSDMAGINNFGSNSGVAFGDFDNDGDDDIYISRTKTDANLLYENVGNNTFNEIGEKAGVAYQGATVSSVWGDIDNDGYLDLYLGNVNETDILYKNNGDGTFSIISALAGIYNNLHPRSVNMADVNNDGYIDIYVANINGQNVLYLNKGNSSFVDNTLESGAVDTQIAMGAVFFDFDNDGDVDLYLTHDAKQANILYQNDGNGIFTNIAGKANVDYQGFGMGVDFGDFNNDGHFDLYITNLFENVLYRNNGDGTFTNISREAGTTDYGMGWGTSWFDYNNDGWQDIYVANDSYFTPFANILYKNMGDNTFSPVSTENAVSSQYAAYGTACTDVNNDGSIDLFVANLGREDGNQLFINNNIDNNWIKILLEGTVSNRSAIGARVEISYKGKHQTDAVVAGSGFASQNSFTMHFGVEKAEKIDQLTIIWPGGLKEIYRDLEVNRSYKAVEAEDLYQNKLITALSRSNSNVNGESLLYPNPFDNHIILKYNLNHSASVNIRILDVNGRVIKQIFKGIQPGGNYSVNLIESGKEGNNYRHGIYMCELITGDQRSTYRIISR